MRISELIDALNSVLLEYGDLEVSAGYSEYPPGFAGVGKVRVEDHTRETLSGKMFAVIDDAGAPMVTEG